MGRSSISLRGLGAIAAICALSCFGDASASAAPLVWTANSTKETVSTFDSGTGKEVGSPIMVGKLPEWIAVTPNGRRAIVVTSNGGDSAVVIDTATRKVLNSIQLGGNGEGVAISPDGTTAYATAEGDEEVHVIDPETATAVGTFKVGGEAEALAFSPNGTQAYVGVAPKEVVTVDTQSEKRVGNAIDVGGNPEWIALTPDGKTAYVTVSGVEGVRVINTALGQVVKTIPTAEVPGSVAVSPDGTKLLIANPTAGTVSVAETATNAIVGPPIAISAGVAEIAIAPGGKTAWVAGGEAVTPINLASGKVETAVSTPGAGAIFLAITPDQSPTAAFAVPGDVTAGVPTTFSGASSTDPDGSVVAWNWGFGDGGRASGVSAMHTYRAPGTYEARLSVVDNEGCGEEEVFTGRTAYCSGATAAVHAVTAKAPAVLPITAATPSNNFVIRRLIHNRRNGTVRLQVKLPSAGYILLFGKKVHAVTRKSKGVQSMWLTIHARVELAKRLKTILRAPVRFRITFTPNGGTPKTVHRTVTLLRAPRHKHHGH
ncbi:MAG: PKD domain-containing protein [Actinobacteria bacterium]|nr:PKD domain-containing protein [Actinomycetota bacterium]